MSKESKEIREIMSDIKQIIKESYTFGQKSEEMLPEAGDFELDNEPSGSSPDGALSGQVSGGIDNEVKNIRKIALSVVMKLTPDENPEDYKLAKGIWDVCDKFLTKDTKDPKQQNNN